jgi:hypothetical protein
MEEKKRLEREEWENTPNRLRGRVIMKAIRKNGILCIGSVYQFPTSPGNLYIRLYAKVVKYRYWQQNKCLVSYQFWSLTSCVLIRISLIQF